MAGVNPLDAALGRGGQAGGDINPLDAALGKHKGMQTEQNPLDVALGAGRKVGGAIAGGASKLGQALDAPGWAVRRLLTGEADTDKQMTKERKSLGLEGAYQATGKIPGVGHFLQGTADTLLQTAQDPLLALGPVVKGLGLGVKAAGLLEKTAPGRLLQDATMWGAKVGRVHGAEARDTARAASNIGKSAELGTSKQMQQMIDKVRSPLSPEEKMQVDRALNGEIETHVLSPAELRAHNQLRRVTNLDYSLRNAPDAVKPQEYKAGLDAPYLGKYLPGVHPKSLEYENRAATPYNRLNPFDPRTLEREKFKVESAEAGDQGFAALAKNTGRQVGARKIREALGVLADSPEVEKLFDVKLPGKGTGRTEWEKVSGGIKSVVGYPRAAIVSLTPRHAGNILNLLANTDPGALPEAMNLARKLIGASDKRYAQLIKEGVDSGAVSGDFIERKPFFQQIPGLAWWTKNMNKITWAVDDAGKTVYAKRIAAKGGNKLAAGGRSARELVDYANVAPITEAARYVAPFATFRTSIPGAVAGGVARNPARAAFLNRATEGTMYGGESKDKTPDWLPWGLGGKHVKMYNPTADIGRAEDPGNALDGVPLSYLRGTLGDIPRMAANKLLAAPPSKAGRAQSDWYTYGEKVIPFKDRNGRWHAGSLAEYAAAGLPTSADVLEQVGVGAFRPRGIPESVLQRVFGVGLRE